MAKVTYTIRDMWTGDTHVEMDMPWKAEDIRRKFDDLRHRMNECEDFEVLVDDEWRLTIVNDEGTEFEWEILDV